MSVKTSLKRVGRALNRPFKKLANRLKASFQRAVLKTIERNPGQIQAITGSTNHHTQVSGVTSSNVDSLLLAFLRSSQRQNRWNEQQTNNFGSSLKLVCDTDGNSEPDTFLARVHADTDVLQLKSCVESALAKQPDATIILQFDHNASVKPVSAANMVCPSSHDFEVFNADSAQSRPSCICTMKRKAA